MVRSSTPVRKNKGTREQSAWAKVPAASLSFPGRGHESAPHTGGPLWSSPSPGSRVCPRAISSPCSLGAAPPRVPPQGLLSPGVVGKGGIQLTGPPRASRPPSTPGHLFLPPLARIRNGLGPQPASERLPCLPTAKLRHRGRFRVGDDVRTSGGASSTGAPSLVHLLRKLRPWDRKHLDGRRLRFSQVGRVEPLASPVGCSGSVVLGGPGTGPG